MMVYCKHTILMWTAWYDIYTGEGRCGSRT